MSQSPSETNQPRSDVWAKVHARWRWWLAGERWPELPGRSLKIGPLPDKGMPPPLWKGLRHV